MLYTYFIFINYINHNHFKTCYVIVEGAKHHTLRTGFNIVLGMTTNNIFAENSIQKHKPVKPDNQLIKRRYKSKHRAQWVYHKKIDVSHKVFTQKISSQTFYIRIITIYI